MEAMMGTKITYEQMYNELKRLSEESPDFTYEKPEGSDYCVFQHRGVPSCMVGQAASNLGTPIEILKLWDENERVIDDDVEKDASDLATLVQFYQDRGYPWSTAFELGAAQYIREIAS
jgi:hypothetical protein